MYGGSKHLWFGINVKSQLFSVQIRSTVWKEEVVTFFYNRAIMSFSAPRLSGPGTWLSKTSGCKNWNGKDTSLRRGKQQCWEQYLLLHSQLRGLDQENLILDLIIRLKSSRFSTREAIANTQGPDLCTDRRAMERERFEVSAHCLNWINDQPWIMICCNWNASMMS